MALFSLSREDLFIAQVKEGNVKQASYLLEEDGDDSDLPNVKDDIGVCMLKYALDSRNVDMVKLLIQSGASVEADMVFSSVRLPPRDALIITELLLNNGANIREIHPFYKWTALHFLLLPGYAEQDEVVQLVTLLLNRGCNCNLKDHEGRLAIEYILGALSSSKLAQAIAAQLLKKGSKYPPSAEIALQPFMPSSGKENALTGSSRAALQTRAESIAGEMQDDSDEAEEEDGRAFHVGFFEAIMQGDTGTVQAVLDEYTEQKKTLEPFLMRTPGKGFTPIMAAAALGALDSLQLLVERARCCFDKREHVTALVNAKSTADGETALSLACEAHSPACCSFLLSSGAAVDVQTNTRGDTAWHRAVSLLDVDLVETFLTHARENDSVAEMLSLTNARKGSALYDLLVWQAPDLSQGVQLTPDREAYGSCTSMLLQYTAAGGPAVNKAALLGLRAETGTSLLHDTVQIGNVVGVKLLLPFIRATGEGINVPDAQGRTALSLTPPNQPVIRELLLQNGAVEAEVKEQEELVLCLPTAPAATAVATETASQKNCVGSDHNQTPLCRCGCIPANLKSLFQMAELRAARQREKQEQAAREDGEKEERENKALLTAK